MLLQWPLLFLLLVSPVFAAATPLPIDLNVRLYNPHPHTLLIDRRAHASTVVASPSATAASNVVDEDDKGEDDDSKDDDSTTTSDESLVQATLIASSALPSAFDSSAAYEFAAGSPCPSFLNKMLMDETFASCYPFSMLIQVGRVFDRITMSYTPARLNAPSVVVDETCRSQCLTISACLYQLLTITE